MSILLKGTNRGTTMDVNGSYKLSLPNDKSALIFRYIGFANQEILVGNKTSH
ncbi:MAG: carboxypeptidase-like regulatory domain-containing protein [Arcicella sp.]|nr:carboxypeptidase-like regulatory domain-containing protein [Arcicella sp.]